MPRMHVLEVTDQDGSILTRLYIGCAREATDIRRWLREQRLGVKETSSSHHSPRTSDEERIAQDIIRRYALGLDYD